MASGWAWTFCFVLCVQSIGALQFRVGGYRGWGLPAGSESYNQWAGNNRFQTGDTLLFKYQQNVDSVLQVSPQNYKTCNTTSPIKSFTDGNTVFKLDRHGAFYFISGNSSNCRKGERLIVVVLSPCNSIQGRNCRNSSSPIPSPNPSPRTSPIPSPSTSPSTSPSPSPRTSPIPSPSPSNSPSPSPSNSPSPSSSPSPSPSPRNGRSPSPSPSSNPSPSLSPTPVSPSLSPSPSISSSPAPAPAPFRSASSSSATSLANLVVPLVLVALLKPNL